MSSCDLGQLLGPFGSLRLENWCAHKITMIYKQRKNRETRSRNLSVFQKLGYILIDCRRYTEEHITVGLFPGDSWWACLLQSGHTWLPFESKLKSFRPSGAQLRILPQTQVSSHLNFNRIAKNCQNSTETLTGWQNWVGAVTKVFRKSDFFKTMKIFRKYENFLKIWKFSKNLKIFRKSKKNWQNLKFFWKSKNFPKIWKSSKKLKFFRKSVWSNVSKVTSL